MDEYIEREAAKNELLSWAVCIYHPEYLLCEDMVHILDSLPAADVKPVRHGRWEKASNLKPKCSVCGEYHLYAWPDHKNCNYCPNCGAKMDGGADND